MKTLESSLDSKEINPIHAKGINPEYSLEGLVGTPCSSQDSQESSLTPQFESVNSLALSLLYGPPLTLVHDSFDYIWTFVSKVMFLLFNILYRFVIAIDTVIILIA